MVKLAVKVWYLRRKNTSNSIQYINAQRKLFRSINAAQIIRREQRKLTGNCIALADLFTLQRDANDTGEKLVQQMSTMKISIDKIEDKFIDMHQKIHNMQNILHKLLNSTQ